MSASPTQEEIDAIAHFIEAIRQLKKSPFFLQEYRSLSISIGEGQPMEEMRGHFPDPEIVRAALVPFRRVWLQSEPCNHARVANLLMRYVEAYRDFLGSLLFRDKTSTCGQFGWFKDCGFSPSEVIDLWLNTRYHHVGASRRTGSYTRTDFDDLERKLGPVLNEFYFLHSVQEVGVSLFNTLGCAERFLEIQALQGQKPSFTYPAREDSRIERSTPGFTPAENSAEQKVWRLRRRREFDGVNRLFEIAALSDGAVANFLFTAEELDALIVASGMRIEHVEDFEAVFRRENIGTGGGAIDSHLFATRNRKCRRGFVGKRDDGSLIWSEDFLPIVRDQYLEFRQAFFGEPFV